MKINYRKILWSHWFFYFISIYLFHALSRAAYFDPFLVERVFSLILIVFLVFLLIWISFKYNFLLSRRVLLISYLFFLMFIYSNFVGGFGFAPVFFLLYSSLIIVLISILTKEYYFNSKALKCFTAIFFTSHIVAYLSGADIFFQQGDRFVGLFSSPTTFATWVVTLFAVSLGLRPFDYDRAGKSLTILNFLLLAFLVFVSGTRTNLALVLFLGAYLVVGGVRSRLLRFSILMSMVPVVLLIYPIYSFLNLYISGEYVAYRFEGEEDTSFGLRVSLFNAVLSELVDSRISDWLFGHGVEASRELVKGIWGFDIFPHNDVLRLVYDFGIVFSAFFFILVSFFASRNHLSFMIGVVYIFSFIHNMVFSHYLISAILIFSMFNSERFRFECLERKTKDFYGKILYSKHPY